MQEWLKRLQLVSLVVLWVLVVAAPAPAQAGDCVLILQDPAGQNTCFERVENQGGLGKKYFGTMILAGGEHDAELLVDSGQGCRAALYLKSRTTAGATEASADVLLLAPVAGTPNALRIWAAFGSNFFSGDRCSSSSWMVFVNQQYTITQGSIGDCWPSAGEGP